MEYEQLMAVIRGRRSVRRFLTRAVPREEIEKLIESARRAPSNHNRQGWYFIVLTDGAAIRRIADETARAIRERFAGGGLAGGISNIEREHLDEFLLHAGAFAEAPCVIVAMHKKPTAISRHMLSGLERADVISGEPISAAMAVENMLLAAQALGLGTCVMTAPLAAGEAFAAAAELPPGYEPTCVIAVGYPGETPPEPRRKAVDKIVEYR